MGVFNCILIGASHIFSILPIEKALELSHGYVTLICGEKEEVFSQNYACDICGFTVPELEPRLFSFNSPIGACNTCSGLGMINEPDINIIMPDQNLSLNEGAVQINGFGNQDTYYFQQNQK